MTHQSSTYIGRPASGLTGRQGILRFSVLGWSAWAPGRESRGDWGRWAGGAGEFGDRGEPSALPMLLRRRLSPFGQKVVGAISACAAGLPPARYILATRHGEFARAVATLEAIEAGDLPSPTDFSMSIHHALLGLLSIHAGNRLGHTALSGGDSFTSGLVEAAACLVEQPDVPVILAYGDDALPDSYAAFRRDGEGDLPLVVAFALGCAGSAQGQEVALERLPDRPAPADDATPAESRLATDFLAFVLSGARERLIAGTRSQWAWRRV